MSNVYPLPIRPEAWLPRQELADLLGVSVSTIDRWHKQGMPSVLWGRRIRRYRPSQCVAWLNSVCDPASKTEGASWDDRSVIRAS